MTLDIKNSDSVANSLLAVSLEPAILLEIERLKSQGGVTTDDLKRVASYSQLLGEKGDQLLFKGKQTAEIFAKTAEAIAVLSFCPGGVTIFGRKYNSNNSPR